MSSRGHLLFNEKYIVILVRFEMLKYPLFCIFSSNSKIYALAFCFLKKYVSILNVDA